MKLDELEKLAKAEKRKPHEPMSPFLAAAPYVVLKLIACIKDIRAIYRPNFKDCNCRGCRAFAKLEGDI